MPWRNRLADTPGLVVESPLLLVKHFHVGVFSLVSGLSVAVHEACESGFFIPYNSIVFLDVIFVALQSQEIEGLISSV